MKWHKKKLFHSEVITCFGMWNVHIGNRGHFKSSEGVTSLMVLLGMGNFLVL